VCIHLQVGRAYSTHGSEEGCVQDFDRKVEKKETTRKIYKYKREDNIKMDLRQIGWRTLVNMVMNVRVPSNVGKFLSS
jgi:hypothetical protein